MDFYRQSIRARIREYGMKGLDQYNRCVLEELEKHPLQICVLGLRSDAKKDFIHAITTITGPLSPPSTMLSRNVSRRPSCENINCPNPGRGSARQNNTGVKPDAGKGLNCVPKLRQFSLGRVKLDPVLAFDYGSMEDSNGALLHLNDEMFYTSDTRKSASGGTSPVHSYIEYGSMPLRPEVYSIDQMSLSHIKDSEIGKELKYDIFLLCIGSRFVRQDDMDLARWCLEQKKRRTLLVYCNLSETNGTSNDTHKYDNSYKTVQRYYRQKLFKHHLSDSPLFITEGGSQEYDYPDLIRILSKWNKRKSHDRKHDVAGLERQSILTIIDQLRKWQCFPSVVCGMLTGLAQGLGLPVLEDLFLVVLRLGIYRRSLGIPLWQKTTNSNKQENMKSVVRETLALAPCTISHICQYSAERLLSGTILLGSSYIVKSVVCGLTASINYITVNRILNNNLNYYETVTQNRIQRSFPDYA